MSVVLTVAIALTQFILGAMGVFVSLRPPEQKYHKHWIGAFVAVGILGIVVTGWLAKSSDDDQKGLTGRLDQSLLTQESMRSQLTTITGMVSGLSENKSDPQLKQLATAITSMAKANQKQESQLVPKTSSQSPFSSLAKEDLRLLVNDSTQLMFGLSKFWTVQIEDADKNFEDMVSKGGPPPGSGHGPMMTRLQFQRDIKPVLPKANDLRKEMLSRVSNVTGEDAIQSKWFANALKEEGVDPPDPDGVTKAANYLQNLAARMIR